MRKDSREKRSGICKGQKVVSEEWDLGASACDTQKAALRGPNTGRGWGSLAQTLQVAALPLPPARGYQQQWQPLPPPDPLRESVITRKGQHKGTASSRSY